MLCALGPPREPLSRSGPHNSLGTVHTQELLAASRTGVGWGLEESLGAGKWWSNG